MAVHYVNRNKIDDQKWNDCVKNSTKPLIYGLTWYLDAAANKMWDALVIDNYAGVLPLPYNHKLIAKQLYTPQFVQQLGPYLQAPHLLKENVHDIKSKLQSILQFNLATGTQIECGEKMIKRLNLILPLQSSFTSAYNNFSKNRRYDFRHIHLDLAESEDINQFIDFFKSSSREIIQQANININCLQRIMQVSIANKMGKIVLAKYRSEILSAVFISDFYNRITLISSTTSQAGYERGANAFLISHLIKQFAETKQVFDFEGSELHGVKEFYKSFGALPEYYYFYTKQNRWIQKAKAILSR